MASPGRGRDRVGTAGAEHPALSSLLLALRKLGVGECRLDARGRVLDANTACCDWLGRDRDDVIGRAIADVAPPEFRASVATVMERLTDDPHAHLVLGEGIMRSTDPRGHRTRLLAGAVRGVDGRVEHAFIVVIDLDGPGIVEAAPVVSPEHAAAVRIADRYQLEPRLREVLLLLATGHRIATIAEMAHLAPGTVRNRIRRLGEALGVAGQTAIVALVQAEVLANGRGRGGDGAQASVNVSPRYRNE